MNDDARGTLVTAVLDSADHRHMEDEVGQFDWFYCIDPDETANAVIAYLYEQAERPEVIRKVAGAIGGGGPESMDCYNEENISAAIRAKEILLAALIGPRKEPTNDN